jgi:hypothetical protein
VWRITLRFAAFPPESLRFALCCSLCSLLLHLCPSSSLSPAQHRRVILCFSLYYTHIIQVHCSVARLFRNAVGAGGWTSVSGSTFDLSALKLTDGSYSPSAFSDEHGQPRNTHRATSFSRHVAPPPLIPLTGAALTLNLCSNVPDTEIPDICASLMKTVGYKTYFVGEGQVLTPSARLHHS